MSHLDPLLVVFFGLFGLTFGSAANVLITRLPAWLDHRFGATDNASLGPRGHRSQCPHCLKPLRLAMLIPILSFFWQRRHCQFCQTRIHWRYPLVEALGGCWFIACLVIYPENPIQASVWAFWGLMLFTMAWIDGSSYWLPNILTLPFLAMGLIASAFGFLPTALTDSAIGALTGWSVLTGLDRAYHWHTQRMGFGGGDAKLLAGLGAWFGWLSLPWILFFSALAGVVFAGVRMAYQRRQLNAHEPLPFGPFLATAAVFMCLYQSGLFDSQ